MEKDYSNLHRGLVLKYYWQVAKHYKVSFYAVILFTIAGSSLDVYVPLQYLKLWDVLSANNFNVLLVAKSVIIFIFVLNLFRWACRRIAGFSVSYFEGHVIAGLREQAFSYMIGNSHSFFSNNFGGSLTQKINKYARSFEKLVDRMTFDGLPLVVRGVGTVVAIYTFLPKYSYILGVFCVVFLTTAFFYIRFKLKYDVIASEADSKTTGALSDSIGNHSAIQLFTGHDFEKERLGEIIKDQRDKTVFNWYLWEGLGALQSLYSYLIEFIVFWVVLVDWRAGIITLPVIVLLQSYLIRLNDSLWSFGGIVRAYYESFADAEEMAVILSTPHEIVDKPMESLNSAKGEVVFDNVTYVYENNNSKVLDNFSLNIPVGQKIAIVGISGAGKTTFVRLLMRLFNLT